MHRVAILGGGGMGTAMAMVLARAGAEVRLWVREPDRAREMAETRRNVRHLPEVVIPESVGITGDPAEAVAGATLLVASIPTTYLRPTLASIAASVPADVPALSVVKGIEIGTFGVVFFPGLLMCPAHADHRRMSRPPRDGRPDRAQPRRGAGARAARFPGRRRSLRRILRVHPIGVQQ